MVANFRGRGVVVAAAVGVFVVAAAAVGVFVAAAAAVRNIVAAAFGSGGGGSRVGWCRGWWSS